MTQSITITPHAGSAVVDARSIPFGVQPTAHMFTARYSNGQWQDARIEPFCYLTMSPLALCLHYGQTVFEGMKAFYMNDGRISIFRPQKHYERFCKSLRRMCMPEVPEALFTEALHQLVQLDAEWVPNEQDSALYIRPFMIATEERLGVKISDEYLFMIVCTPAYKYYSKPLRVKIETEFARAAEGGTGEAKCGGNYGAAYYPTQLAKEVGFDQVVWTDSKTHELIEESGTMNLMFVIDDTLLTPPLSGTILDGVTRESLLTLAKEHGYPVSEQPIRWRDLQAALESGKRVEAFGAGTAAVVAPIEAIAIGNDTYPCYIGEDAMMFKLQKLLADVRTGAAPDTHDWNYVI